MSLDITKNNSSLLTQEQKNEVLRRSDAYKASEIKGYKIEDAQKLIREKLSRQRKKH